MERKNLGILQITIKDGMLDDNNEITLESAIENHWDSIVELIKNPRTTKLVLLNDEFTDASVLLTRENTSFFAILSFVANEGELTGYAYIDIIINENQKLHYRYIEL